MCLVYVSLQVVALIHAIDRLIDLMGALASMLETASLDAAIMTQDLVLTMEAVQMNPFVPRNVLKLRIDH